MTPERIEEYQKLLATLTHANILADPMLECLGEIRNYRQALDQANKTSRFQIAEIERQQQRIEKLEAALKPFAEAWELWVVLQRADVDETQADFDLLLKAVVFKAAAEAMASTEATAAHAAEHYDDMMRRLAGSADTNGALEAT